MLTVIFIAAVLQAPRPPHPPQHFAQSNLMAAFELLYNLSNAAKAGHVDLSE